MRAKRTVAMMTVAIAAVACGKSKPAANASLNDQLRSDLDRAAAPTSEIVASRYRATQVVSPVELGMAPAPRASAAPQKRVTHRAKPSAKPTVEPVAAVALDPSPTPTVVASAPAPEPTSAGTSPTGDATKAGQEPHHGGGIGGIIGVIIRGGTIGDDDHCEIRPRVPISINSRIPIAVGMPRGPHGSW
ncbi:MAG: hypothetical protein IRY91_14940 [Gemmatimonadaceae bacterium]|nr:hypothetical protein [Gemmatimonadaceae bacterium]